VKVALLSGGVGGARLARGFSALDRVDLTVVVNVGDDERVYGLAVSPDLDTVVYTMAGMEGGQGWGRFEDTFDVMKHLSVYGADTTFRLGDADLATNLYRTTLLDQGVPLSEITRRIAATWNLNATILPATDDQLRTEVETKDGWLSFQEYFVFRKHVDEVVGIRFAGAETSRPGPKVVEAIDAADLVVIAPSNPPLSIWPILNIAGITGALAEAKRVVAVSPLVGGKALKGPADRVLASLGFSPGNQGVAEAYGDLLDVIVVHHHDDPPEGLTVRRTDTLMPDRRASIRLARFLVE